MKATLIIKNIASLYTCDEEFNILHDAFIALVHDVIVDLGTHDYHAWMDDSTTIIDAYGQIVIPGLIESSLQMPNIEQGYDWFRQENALIHYMLKNGILSFVSAQCHLQYASLKQQVYYRPESLLLNPIGSIREYLECKDEDFILSCKYHPKENPVYSMLPLASALFKNFDVPADALLKAMTCNPAKACQLDSIGVLKKGRQADLLVVHSYDLERFFRTEGLALFSYMIKRGIPIYPTIRRV